MTSENTLVFENYIWMDTKEAAKFLRTTPGQIRNWVYLGKVPAYRLLGKKLLFKIAELNLLVQRLGGQRENIRA